MPQNAASEIGRDVPTAMITPKFQLRDAKIEALCWAIKAELEAEAPSNRLYAESLALALAIRLIEVEDQPPRSNIGAGQTLPMGQRRLLVEYIVTHLDQSLTVADLATLVGLSASHFKTLFRNTFGIPVHRYVIRCRVERARLLLLSGDMPMSQIALEAGFADQGHMAKCIRRILGLTPSAIARMRF